MDGVINLVKPRAEFQIGRIYDRRSEINGPFGGSAQSGISPSKVADAVFLFAGPGGTAFGYEDSEKVDKDGGITFSYTGEGQVGDMEFSKGNKAILEHSKNGRALHLFRSMGKSKGQKYVGEFVYAEHNFVTGPDRNKMMRKVIVFELISVQTAESLELTLAEVGPIIVPKTLAEARSLAIAAASATSTGSAESASRKLYIRSKAVKDYVLMRAAGTCESCQKPAPFKRANGPVGQVKFPHLWPGQTPPGRTERIVVHVPAAGLISPA